MTKTKLGVGGTKKKPPAGHRFHWTDEEIDAFIDLVSRIGMQVFSNPAFVQALQLIKSFS
jgi:hypothetical protein